MTPLKFRGAILREESRGKGEEKGYAGAKDGLLVRIDPYRTDLASPGWIAFAFVSHESSIGSSLVQLPSAVGKTPAEALSLLEANVAAVEIILARSRA